MALFGVALFLLFLIQCLRIFDVVAVQGQGFLTLMGQALLGMPLLAVVFIHVCLGIGLGRALERLQGSNELQVIHANRLVPSLLGAVASFAGLGAVAVLLLANFVEPLANRQMNQWTTSIAADLVSTTLTPHRFTQVAPQVTLSIGGRGDDGQITAFFADDGRNPAIRRTYVAQTAVLGEDSEGYVLQLNKGAMQYMSADGQFSEVAFERYDIALDRLTGTADARKSLDDATSLELAGRALATGGWSDDVVRKLAQRMGEAVRVVAMCLFVTALAAFPHGQRRRRQVPIELLVLASAFIERGVSTYLPVPDMLASTSGSLLLAALAVVVLAIRLRRRAPPVREARPA